MANKLIIASIGAGVAYLLYRSYYHPSGDQSSDNISRLASSICAGIFIGLLAIFYLLPALAQKFAQTMYADANEKVGPDLLREARSHIAQGDYELAVVAYRKVIHKDPSHRLAWTDMAKLYAEKLEQPRLAAASLQEAYEEHEWDEEDATYILFRTSEWQLDGCEDQKASIVTLTKIINAFPNTRHSANATQQLKQLGHEVSKKPT